MELTNIPKDSPSLIKLLDQKFPERTPSPTMSDREIWIEVGKRELVRHLLALQELEEEQLMENELCV